jgi:DNA-binding transcriptional MocR family regulator
VAREKKTASCALRADGYLISRTGAGSFTAVPAGTRASSSTARWAPPGVPPDLIDLTCATPAGPAMAISDAVAADSAHLPLLTAGTGYDPVGVPRLREAIAARFAARGVPTDASAAGRPIALGRAGRAAVDALERARPIGRRPDRPRLSIRR